MPWFFSFKVSGLGLGSQLWDLDVGSLFWDLDFTQGLHSGLRPRAPTSIYIIFEVSVCPVVVVLGGKGVRVSTAFIMNIFGLMI